MSRPSPNHLFSLRNMGLWTCLGTAVDLALGNTAGGCPSQFWPPKVNGYCKITPALRCPCLGFQSTTALCLLIIYYNFNYLLKLSLHFQLAWTHSTVSAPVGYRACVVQEDTPRKVFSQFISKEILCIVYWRVAVGIFVTI